MSLNFVSEHDQLIKTIQLAIPEAEVFILDPRRDGVHLEAIVISDLFIEKTLLEQHRMVMKPLEPLFAGGLHAMGVKTFTRDAWTKNRKRFPNL